MATLSTVANPYVLGARRAAPSRAVEGHPASLFVCARPRCRIAHECVPAARAVCGPWYVYGSLRGTASEMLRILDDLDAKRVYPSRVPVCCRGSGTGAHSIRA